LFQKIRELSKNLAIYGVGDVAIQIANFLLLRLYVEYLTPADYGILALLGTVESLVKLCSRWGVDGSFMRFWYECRDDGERQRLSSTIFFFLLALNGALLLVSVLAAPFLSTRLLGSPGYTLALQLVLLNTFAIAFTFIPFHVLRIQNRSREFSALTLARSVSTLVLRIVLIVGFGLGVMGIVVADVIVTGVMMAVIVRWMAPLIRPVFSLGTLREALSFGLPRVPHGFALQVMAVGDRLLLERAAVPMAEIGRYSMGVSFGLIPKIALGAFEYAWAPFYYATSREPDAPRVFSTVATYGVAVLALMTAGLSAIASDLLTVVTGGQYTSAAPIVVWTAVGVFCSGVYLLTSIGLNITKRSQYYPVSSLAGAAVNVILNLMWIPQYGIIGSAWANGAAYACQAVIAFTLSQRFYPIRYEYGRIARVLVAAAVAYVAAGLLPPMPALAGLLARGATVVGVMAVLLAVTRFLRPDELRGLKGLWERRKAPPSSPPPETTELAGEIVSTDLPDDDLAPLQRRP
jgi:O-antigen/teichoic acid export membrane protein